MEEHEHCGKKEGQVGVKLGRKERNKEGIKVEKVNKSKRKKNVK